MEVALRRFARDGYHTTKISDIVAEAGVSQGTFYWYFPSKEAIALEMIAEGRGQLLDVIAQGYRKHMGTVADMVEASEALLRNLFEFAEANRHLMELLLGGWSASEPIRLAIGQTRAAMENAFVQNIKRAVELRMLPSTIDAHMRAAILMSLIEGIILRWLVGSAVPGNGFENRTAAQLAAETARFEFFGLLGI
ncbi:helix-turn-helix transcriptional regulator [Cohnella pontilimi]|uniref:Helix-turn-helix transcriptional regulator n=1 Tax=Cohnella pontilimi TaxID=2564100 RepID=A0A4U0FAW0_9BACL|nr:TetR/AcrR family transcriptional regulator [Cohnella pontilimi]TJY41791.1 helix-turn-helix transcriptional regulator [Cohnella pontilimi]